MAALNGSEIFRQLVSSIEDGTLTPGERLREAELAERYGVSRTPIREGLKRLESHGLATYEPNRGMIIPLLDNDQINELYVVRAVLEGTVVRFAAQHATAAEISIFKDMIEADRAAIDDAEALSRSNRAFHRRLTLASHNRYLIAQVDHMKHFLLLLSGNTFVDQKRREAAVDEHAQIVAAIAARDMDAAEAAGRDHIRAAHKVRLQTMG
jgi:DNA-binding GntR family transcriptional regulator